MILADMTHVRGLYNNTDDAGSMCSRWMAFPPDPAKSTEDSEQQAQRLYRKRGVQMDFRRSGRWWCDRRIAARPVLNPQAKQTNNKQKHERRIDWIW